MKPRHCDPNRKRREKQPPPSKDKIQFETRAQARQNSGPAQATWAEAFFCLDLLLRVVRNYLLNWSSRVAALGSSNG